MKVYLAIAAEVSEDYVLADIIKVLETALPYMADNVFVTVPQAEEDNEGQTVLYIGVG